MKDSLSELVNELDGIKTDLEQIEGVKDPEVIDNTLSDVNYRLDDTIKIIGTIISKIEYLL